MGLPTGLIVLITLAAVIMAIGAASLINIARSKNERDPQIMGA